MWEKLLEPDGLVSKSVLAAASVPVASYVVPMWGAPLSSFGLAALGSFMSYAWNKPEDSRKMLVFKSISVTLFSVSLVVVMPDILGWDLRPESQPPLAFIVATFGRQIIMGLRKAAPIASEAIAGIFGNRGNYRSSEDYGDRPDDRDEIKPDGPRKTNEPPEGY